MERTIEIVGVPTSAAAYAPGQEAAPAALREAGLVGALRSRGMNVVDRQDDPPSWRWRPDPADSRAQNLGPTVAYAGNARARVAGALAGGHVPLVLGGDCTVELGVVAAHLDAGHRVGLVYLDLHADLNVPHAVAEGALDWMGLAHMLDRPGSRPELAGLGPRRPLLDPSAVTLFGFDPNHASGFEREEVERLGLRVAAWQAIADDPEGEAERLLTEWGRGCDRLIVHFDVDVLNFIAVPLAEYTFARDAGLTLDQAARALGVLAADPRFSALTVTEINPAHGAADGSTLRAFAAALAGSLEVLHTASNVGVRPGQAGSVQDA